MSRRVEAADIFRASLAGCAIATAIFLLGWIAWFATDIAGPMEPSDVLLGIVFLVLFVWPISLIVAAFTALPIALLLGWLTMRFWAVGPPQATGIGAITGTAFIALAALVGALEGLGFVEWVGIFAALGASSGYLAYRITLATFAPTRS